MMVAWRRRVSAARITSPIWDTQLNEWHHRGMSDEKLRDAFDESALVYHSARPAYPAELYDDLLAITRISPPSKLALRT